MIVSIGHATKINEIDTIEYMSSYYDPTTGLELKGELQDSGRNPLQSPKIIFRGLPCFCDNLTCGCCAGVNLTAVNFNRRACTKFTYDPDEFAVNMAFSMNEKEVFSSSLSAKNPPPVCIPFVYFPAITFCARLFDIHTPGRNLHACLDLETRVVNAPILILHFNCVKVGADGISLAKPGENFSNFVPTPNVSEPEIYDEVNFEQSDFEDSIVGGTTLSPEEEASIGQLKY
ncbi:hypothetical protein KPH14_005507 [Odynerus spinipes]|uniref:DUF4773 domain-containing protein n=1 Tax=Odynerus spinipes TaxID=1348599 RepID=A0AAD9RC02_9HYME|nr:hypothetical protein KPH14_005507 [Odynerus spinipes]